MQKPIEHLRKLKLDPNAVYVIPLGGCGEFGLNMTLYVHQGQILIVDCGVMFPDPKKLGIDAVILDLEHWLPQLGKVAGYFITHGHEDHIGALPYIVPQFPAPIYATAWAVASIKQKFQRHGLEADYPITVVASGDQVEAPGAKVTWIHINHSIPMTCSLLLEIGPRRIFHTGDFKLDRSSPYEVPFDQETFIKLGQSGIDLMVADSTNAGKPGWSESEQSVINPLRHVIAGSPARAFVSLFSSNLWRIRTVLELCEELRRPVAIVGQGLESVISVGQSLGLVNLPKLCMSADEVAGGNYPNLVVLVTGSQGEARAALSRIVHRTDRYLSLQRRDRIIFSSRLIPGNERSVYGIVSKAEMQDAEVLMGASAPGIHVSGHAHSEEIDALIRWLRPSCYLPVHGTFSQMKANQRIALDYGLKNDHVPLVEDGTILELRTDSITEVGCFEVTWKYADSESLMPIDHMNLRQRLKIGEQGLICFFAVYSRSRSDWATQPFWDLRGLPESQALSQLLVSLEDELSETCSGRGEEASEVARQTIRRGIGELFGKRAVVIAKVEVIR